MSIKTAIPVLTREDFVDACKHSSLSLEDVAKQVGTNRQYLSEFRAGSRNLQPELLKRIREFFESQGLEFSTQEEPTEDGSEAQQVAVVDPMGEREGLSRSLFLLRHFAIDPGLSMEQINAALDRMDANEAEMRKILAEKVERGFIDGWSDKTESHLFDLMGKLAENFTLFRHLQGRPLVRLEEKVRSDDVQSIGDLLNNLLHDSIGDLAETLTVQAEAPEEPQEEEEAVQ